MKKPAGIISGSITVLFRIEVGMIILLFLGLAFFSYPSSDDYCFANRCAENGFWPAQMIWYQGWTGRYTYIFAGSLFGRESILEKGGYFLIPIIFFLMLWGSLYLLSTRIIPFGPGRWSRAGWISAFLVLYLTHLPDPGALYWLTGIIKYQLAAVGLLLFAAVVIGQPGRAPGPRGPGFTIKALFLAVLIVGTSETAMLLIGCFLAAVTVTVWLRTSPDRFSWLIILAGAAAAAAVVYFAPGNRIRFARMIHSRDPGMIIPALEESCGWAVSRVFSPALIFLSILFVIRIQESGIFPARASGSRWRPLLPLGWITAVFLSFLPSFWAGRCLLSRERLI